MSRAGRMQLCRYASKFGEDYRAGFSRFRGNGLKRTKEPRIKPQTPSCFALICSYRQQYNIFNCRGNLSSLFATLVRLFKGDNSVLSQVSRHWLTWSLPTHACGWSSHGLKKKGKKAVRHCTARLEYTWSGTITHVLSTLSKQVTIFGCVCI